MKIALIDPSSYITNYGLRCISSYLWQNNIETKLLFLFPSKSLEPDWYSKEVLEELVEHVKDCDIIGFSVFTNYYFPAAKLSAFLKEKFPEKTIVWGGIHATASPETSIKHADVLCIGEGEETVLELAKNLSENKMVDNILGTWVKKKDGTVIKNEARMLEQNLDKYPYQDYEYSHMHLIRQNHIVPVTPEMMKELLHMGSAGQQYFGLKQKESFQYLTMTARGCPFSCTYCCNNAYKKIYTGKGKWLRSRSIEHVIGELKYILKKYGYVNFISFFDDDFCARPNEFINQFCDVYQKEINLPFKCNLHTYGVNKEKIQKLVTTGLTSVEIGLQSGSERVHKDIYKRGFNQKIFLDAAKILADFPQIITYYDVILDNPYETEEDTSLTIKFLAKLPKPFHLSCFSLTFFPGTEMYDRAVADGLVNPNDLTTISGKINNRLYFNNAYSKMLILLSGKTTPLITPVFTVLGHPAFIKLLSGKKTDEILQKVFTKTMKTYSKIKARVSRKH